MIRDKPVVPEQQLVIRVPQDETVGKTVDRLGEPAVGLGGAFLRLLARRHIDEYPVPDDGAVVAESRPGETANPAQFPIWLYVAHLQVERCLVPRRILQRPGEAFPVFGVNGTDQKTPVPHDGFGIQAMRFDHAATDIGVADRTVRIHDPLVDRPRHVRGQGVISLLRFVQRVFRAFSFGQVADDGQNRGLAVPLDERVPNLYRNDPSIQPDPALFVRRQRDAFVEDPFQPNERFCPVLRRQEIR